ncbi:MAG: hypothetical protein L6Q77_01925 [Bacteroidetes bacterium]|nr:hypothetical protein [Bacteroidota bacterium]
MKKLLTFLTAALLFLNWTGAFFGGYHLVTNPDGSSLGLPISYLAGTPFSDYLIPGIILLAVNGFLGLTAFLFVVLGHPKAPWLIMLQGILLSGWILVQILLIQVFHPFQAIFGSIGLILFASGYYSAEREPHQK